jgi:hypothetical protein
MENFLASETLESKDKPTLQKAIEEDRRFVNSSLDCLQVISLVAQNKPTIARDKIIALQKSPCSPALRDAVSPALQNILQKLFDQIVKSDQIRATVQSAVQKQNYELAATELEKAMAIDLRPGDEDLLQRYRREKVKNAFEKELGL